MRAVFFLFFSYIAAAPLTSYIEMDLTQTNWASLWTYFFWVFSLVIWLAIFFVVVPLFLGLLALVMDR